MSDIVERLRAHVNFEPFLYVDQETDMEQAADEIERLRGLLLKVMWHVKDEWRLDPQEGANVLVFDGRQWCTQVREALGDE